MSDLKDTEEFKAFKQVTLDVRCQLMKLTRVPAGDLENFETEYQELISLEEKKDKLGKRLLDKCEDLFLISDRDYLKTLTRNIKNEECEK